MSPQNPEAHKPPPAVYGSVIQPPPGICVAVTGAVNTAEYMADIPVLTSAVPPPPPPPVGIEAMSDGHEDNTEPTGTLTPFAEIADNMSLRHALSLVISSAIDDSGMCSLLDCVHQRSHAADKRVCGIPVRGIS